MILFRRTCRQADASLTILSAPDSVSEGELSAVLFACIAKVRPNVLMPPSLRAKHEIDTFKCNADDGSRRYYFSKCSRLQKITVTADAAYQGASGGVPRNVDKPANRIEDIHGMADFISQYPGVDSTRIGLLGICGGGGYSLAAAETDKRFKSIATISMFNSGLVRRNGMQDSQLDTIQQRLQQASDARAQEVAGGEVLYSGDANLTDEQIAKLPFALYRQGYEYYWKTHAHPNSTFKYTTSSLLDLMNSEITTY